MNDVDAILLALESATEPETHWLLGELVRAMHEQERSEREGN